ncbi:cell envelope protein, partial [Mycobacterium sp. ITM-2017-0098]
QELKDNYLYRMAGAALGIYGNTAAEAIYPNFTNDSAGAPLTGGDAEDVLVRAGQLPPVNAFWSLTAYELPASSLVPNPINRYLINSPMLPSLV